MDIFIKGTYKAPVVFAIPDVIPPEAIRDEPVRAIRGESITFRIQRPQSKGILRLVVKPMKIYDSAPILSKEEDLDGASPGPEMSFHLSGEETNKLNDNMYSYDLTLESLSDGKITIRRIASGEFYLIDTAASAEPEPSNQIPVG